VFTHRSCCASLPSNVIVAQMSCATCRRRIPQQMKLSQQQLPSSSKACSAQLGTSLQRRQWMALSPSPDPQMHSESQKRACKSHQHTQAAARQHQAALHHLTMLYHLGLRQHKGVLEGEPTMKLISLMLKHYLKQMLDQKALTALPAAQQSNCLLHRDLESLWKRLVVLSHLHWSLSALKQCQLRLPFCPLR